MIEFTSLDAEGFCSISSMHLTLNDNHTTIIRGFNGAGKSTVFSSLVWCLYGKSLKGVSEVNTWPSARSRDYQGTKVEVFFKRDNQIHHIVRCQNWTAKLPDGARGASRLLYDIDTVPVPQKFKNDIQDAITKALGMSYNLFINSVMFGQGIAKLVDASGSDQKMLFEEMFATEYLTQAREIAKSHLNECTDKLQEIEREQSRLENSKKLAKENLAEVRKLSRNQSKIIQDKIFDLQLKRKENEDIINELRSSGLYADRTINDRVEEVRGQVERNKEKLSEAKQSVSGVTVPGLISKCIDLLEHQDAPGALKYLRSVKSIYSVIDSCQSKASSMESALLKLERDKHERDTIVNKLNSLKVQQDSLREREEEVKNSNKDYKSLIEKSKSQIRSIDEKLEQLQDSDSYKKQAEIYKWAISYPLSNNGIKAFLFESSLDSINASLKKYSNILGFSIFFGIDLESARKDLVISISMNGQTTSFRELSGGQKQLVNFAIALAMNEAVTASKGVNIAFLDEVFESLSSNNVELVCEMLSKIYRDKTLFIITHQESLPVNAQVINVSLSDGLSEYKR